tara:strand:- start:536 stop:1234 length:699 start_codon:yes stop_codon:yes gene_type:complete
MMKCDDFKFEYTVAPNEAGAEAKEHLASCEQCQIFAAQENLFEQQLKEVVNQGVPSSLKHSIRDYVYKAPFWSATKMKPIAFAASLLLAVGLVTFIPTQNEESVLPIDQLVYEHFSHDGASSTHVAYPLNEQELIKLSKEFGIRVRLAKNISFAKKCPIGDSYGLHMVYQYHQQAITIIYMPDISLDKTLPFHYAGLHGWVKPLKNGSMAVLAGTTTDIPDEEFASNAVEWL